jgi:hypothetical protein
MAIIKQHPAHPAAGGLARPVTPQAGPASRTAIPVMGPAWIPCPNVLLRMAGPPPPSGSR